MKIRTQFVSNSSSSSFAFIGKEIKINKIKDTDLKNSKYIAVGGSDWGEGALVVDIKNADFLKWYQSDKCPKKINFYEVAASSSEWDTKNHLTEEIVQLLSKDPESWKLYTLTADQNTPDNINEMGEFYREN